MNDEEELTSDLAKALSRLPLIPDDVIQEVHSYGIAEDNETLVVMLDLVGG